MKSNCYLVVDKTKEKGIVIDPGDDADYIQRTISDLDFKPRCVIATHAHFDHVMASREIALGYSIPFYIHRLDLPLLKKVQKSALHFTKVAAPPPAEINDYLTEETNALGPFNVQIYHTPGHTPGSVSIQINSSLFVGDLVFEGGYVGRTDFSYCSKSDLDSSIMTLLKLPKDTVIYPGHGDETTIGALKECFV